MGNPDLALNLELIRTLGMTLDHFVSLAARSESTQRAAKRFSTHPNDGFQQREQQPKWRQNFGGNSSQNMAKGQNFAGNINQHPQPKEDTRNQWKCYNCDEYGHLSRNCSRPRTFMQNQPINQQKKLCCYWCEPNSNPTPKSEPKFSNTKTKFS